MRGSRHSLYLAACSAMFVFGMVVALPGTVLGLPDVVARFDLNLAKQGALISCLFFGLLWGCVVSGPLVDAVGHRVVLGGASAAVAASLPLFVAASSLPLAAAAFATIGFASAGVNITANALSSDLFPEERGRRMNGLAIAVGLGGLSLPAATALMVRYGHWSAVVMSRALIAAAVAVVALRLETPGTSHGTDADAPGLLHVLRRPGLPWVALLVALGAGTEASMAGFTSPYLGLLGFMPAAATWLLASHWVGLIVGRVVFANRVDRSKRRAITTAALAGAAGVLVFATAPAMLVVAVMPFAIGIAIAIVVPTSLALGGERYPGSGGTLFGLLLTSAQVGGMALPALIGIAAEAAGGRAAISIIALNNVLLAGVCLKTARYP